MKYKVGDHFQAGSYTIRIRSIHSESYKLEIVYSLKTDELFATYVDSELDKWEFLPLYNSPLYKAMNEDEE